MVDLQITLKMSGISPQTAAKTTGKNGKGEKYEKEANSPLKILMFFSYPFLISL